MSEFGTQLKQNIGRAMRTRGRRWAFPLRTDQAFEVLRSCGYRVGTTKAGRVGYDEAVRYGEMDRPPRQGKHSVWDESRLLALGVSLERHRRWLPGCHRQRKTFAEVESEAGDFKLGVEAFGAWCESTARELVMELARTEHVGRRYELTRFLLARSPRVGGGAVTSTEGAHFSFDDDSAWLPLLLLIEDERDAAARQVLAQVFIKRQYDLRMEPCRE